METALNNAEPDSNEAKQIEKLIISVKLVCFSHSSKLPLKI